MTNLLDCYRSGMIASPDAKARSKGTLAFSRQQKSVLMFLALFFLSTANAGLKPVANNPPNGQIRVKALRHQQDHWFLECSFVATTESMDDASFVFVWTTPKGVEKAYQESTRTRSLLYLPEAITEDEKFQLVGRYSCTVYRSSMSWVLEKGFSASIDMNWVSVVENRQIVAKQSATLRCSHSGYAIAGIEESKKNFLWRHVKGGEELRVVNESNAFLHLNSVPFTDNGTIYDCYEITKSYVLVLRKRFYISVQQPALTETPGTESGSMVPSQSSSSSSPSSSSLPGRTSTPSVSDLPTETSKKRESDEHKKTQIAVIASVVPSAVVILVVVVVAGMCRRKRSTSSAGKIIDVVEKEAHKLGKQVNAVGQSVDENKRMMMDKAEEEKN